MTLKLENPRSGTKDPKICLIAKAAGALRSQLQRVMQIETLLILLLFYLEPQSWALAEPLLVHWQLYLKATLLVFL